MAISQVGSPLSYTSAGAGITTVSVAVPVGVDFMRVGFGMGHYATFAITAVTLNGVSLVQVPNSHHITDSYYSTDQWYMISPPSGTYDLAVTGEGNDCVIGIDFWAGCHMTSPIGDAAIAYNLSSQNPEVNIVDYGTGDVALGVCVSTANYGTPKTDNTEQWYLTSLGVSTDRCEGSYSTSTGLLSWNTSAAGIWVATGFALKPLGRTVKPVSGVLALAGSVAKLSSRAFSSILSFSSIVSTFFGGVFYSISASTDGTNLTVTFNTTVSVIDGVAGFAWSVDGSPPIVGIDAPGAATNQSITVPLSTLGASLGNTLYIDVYYSLTNPAGTKVYASDEGKAFLVFLLAVAGVQYKSVSGVLSITGTLTRSINRGASGTLTFIGAPAKNIRRALSGVLSFTSGIITTSFVKLISLAGALFMSGHAAKRINVAIAGWLYLNTLLSVLADVNIIVATVSRVTRLAKVLTRIVRF